MTEFVIVLAMNQVALQGGTSAFKKPASASLPATPQTRVLILLGTKVKKDESQNSTSYL